MDISKFVFHPPSYMERDFHKLLEPNESIHFTGDMDNEPTAHLDDLLKRYSNKPSLLTQTNNKIEGEINPVLFMVSQPSPFRRSLKLELNPKTTSKEKKLRVPFLIITPEKKTRLKEFRNDMTLILFHSNAEDIFKAASLGRNISETFEVARL